MAKGGSGKAFFAKQTNTVPNSAAMSSKSNKAAAGSHQVQQQAGNGKFKN